MKARIALIVVLSVIIAAQISYLVKRISSADYSTPGAPGGAMPGGGPDRPPPGPNGPMAAMPGPSGMPYPAPSGMPHPGPSGMPYGAPNMKPYPVGAPSGNPNNAPGPVMAPSGMPMARPAAMGPEMLPFNEVLSGLLQMQSHSEVALSAEQKAKLRPLIGSLSDLIARTKVNPQELAQIVTFSLRPPQVEFILKHRAEPPPIDQLANGNGPPGPAVIGQAALKVLKQRAAEASQGESPASSPSGESSAMMLGPEDLLSGVLKLESDKKLALTPAQAKALEGPLENMVSVEGEREEKTHAIIGVLNDDQKKFLLKVHETYLSNSAKGGEAPPEQMLADLQKQLQ